MIGRAYWRESRSHRYSLLFALPLLLLYELLEAIAPVRAAGGTLRNGADVLLTGFFTALLGPRGPLVFMALVIGGAILLIRRDRGGPLRGRTFVAMAAEASVLALVVGVVVGTATMRIVGPLRALAMGTSPLPEPVLARMTLALGAGLYEELLFRVVLVALIANALRLAGASRLAGGTVAVIAGALIFSGFHYVGPYGDQFRLDSFVFRALAGVTFSALYLTRGFGITAWTHALYDVAVML